MNCRYPIASLCLFSSLIVFACGCGQTAAEAEPQPAQDTATDASSPADTGPAAQLKKDLAEAVRQLENGELASFIENYMPLDNVEAIREFTTVEEIAKKIKKGGLFEKEWLKKLKAMENGEVTFLDAEKSRARFTIEIGGEEGGLEHLLLPNPAEEKIPDTPGFAGDLDAAMAEAVKTLKAGDHQKFVENIFPPGELYILQSKQEMEGLLKRLKDHPQMAEQMLADLEALQKLTPKYNEDRSVASYELNANTPAARTVTFEKAGTWRFADNATKIRTEMHKQSKQPPIAVKKTLETEWVRIRDHWRLKTFR